MSDWSEISISSYLIKKGTDVMASQYVSYTMQASFNGEQHTVERRFSEFVYLQKELAKEFPGAIIAPLPKDQVFGRFKPAFIESRMRGLEDCLKKTANDSAMINSVCWTPFFTSPSFNETALNEAKSNRGTAGVAIQKKSSWLDSMKTMAAVTFTKTTVDTAEMDARIQEISDYVTSYTSGMKRISDAAGSLADESEGEATTLESLSANSKVLGEKVLLARNVDSDPEATVFIQFGDGLTAMAGELQANAVNKNVRVKEPIENYSRVLNSMKAAVKRQNEVKKTYIASVADHQICQAAQAKEPASMEKITKTEAAKERLDAAEAEYNSMSETLLKNFAKIKEDRVYEIVQIAESLIDLELETCNSSQRVLEGLLSDLS